MEMGIEIVRGMGMGIGMGIAMEMEMEMGMAGRRAFFNVVGVKSLL